MKPLLLILCLLCSCGTSKHSTDIERHESTDISLSDSILRKDSSIAVEQILLNENMQAHITIVEWSKPDSTGMQFPVKTTDINLNRQKEEQSKKAEQSGSENLQVKKKDLSNQTDERVKEDVKKDNRPVPTWIWWFLIIGGVISALLTWYTRK